MGDPADVPDDAGVSMYPLPSGLIWVPGDDQSGAGPLDVVVTHQVVGRVSRLAGPHPGQRRHQHPLRKLEVADGQRVEE